MSTFRSDASEWKWDGRRVRLIVRAGATKPHTRSNDRFAAEPDRVSQVSGPLGYYEYLPPNYGDGDPSPLLVFLHGLLESGDGTEAQLKRLLADGGSIPC